ncbi:MAG: hypothetical protein FIB04_13945 [Gammaproteobacteria bacterium]|nr:hypothetical protein [Gammaproteobacteria bacterium]
MSDSKRQGDRLLTRRRVIGALGAAAIAGFPAIAAARRSRRVKAPPVPVLADGYADRLSYRPGDRATLYLNGIQAGQSTLGLYDLAGKRVQSFSAGLAPQAPMGPNPWETGFGYQPSTTLAVPNLRSGVYLVENLLPVIVKPANRDNADVIIVVPTNTEAAYNSNGGRSMYTKAPDTAPVVSFLRPTARPLPAYADQFLLWMASLKLPYSCKYCADVDLDDYAEIAGARLIVLIGHSEYWTRRARENFDRFVLEGGNALVLSGNSMWWQVRYNDERTQMICYKWQTDPVADPMARTLNWVDPTLQYPLLPSLGADFLGGGIADDPADAGWNGFKVLLPNSPVFRGVPVAKGDILSMRSHEYDGAPLLNNPVTQGEPVLDLAAMGAHRAEIIGYDYGRHYRTGADTVGTWIAMQRTASSGIIINGASTDWCGMAGLGGRDGDKMRKIISNMLTVLVNDQPVFVT